MAWASILGGIAGGAASLGNTALNQYFVGQNMKAQYSYWKKAQLNQPSLQREGLEKAGYNPMLALSGGGASFTPSVSSYTPDLVSSAKHGADIARDIKKAEEEREARLDNINADTKNKNLESWQKGLDMFTELLEAAALGRALGDRNGGAKGTPVTPSAGHPFPADSQKPPKTNPPRNPRSLPKSKPPIDLLKKPNPFSKMLPWLLPLAIGSAGRYGLPLLGTYFYHKATETDHYKESKKSFKKNPQRFRFGVAVPY